MHDDLSHVDSGALAELREVMEEEFDILIDTFLDDSVDRMQQIREALASGDPVAYSRACHSFKGSATNMGLPRLAALCREGEEDGRAGKMERAAMITDAIEDELAAVRQELAAQKSG
ncbi:Hpt domain-containing protein [Hahella sp. SMD15-11]|uniref:Hpt domain-containing protein n=1 Tax=Thermohahella caldifontis TaxID=3142973 RepID=A0AB39UY06_9GAMM